MPLSPFSPIPRSTSTTPSLQIPPALSIYAHGSHGERRQAHDTSHCLQRLLRPRLHTPKGTQQLPSIVSFLQWVDFLHFRRQPSAPTTPLSIHHHVLRFAFVSWSHGSAHHPSPAPALQGAGNSHAPTKALSSSAVTSPPPTISRDRLLPSAFQQLLVYYLMKMHRHMQNSSIF